MVFGCVVVFFFSSRRRHTRYWRDWSSDVCSSDLDVHHGGADVVPDRVHARVVALLQGLVVLGGGGGLGQRRRQAHALQRRGDQLVELDALVVAQRAHGRVEVAEDLVAVLLRRGDRHPHRADRLLHHVLVLLRQVAPAVEHRQGHDVPVQVDVADLRRLQDPAAGQPRPRAQRVEPEVHAGLRGGALHCLCHAFRSSCRRCPAVPRRGRLCRVPSRPARRLFRRSPWWGGRAVRAVGVSGGRGKLPCVAVPNLTRDDAAARARLLAVDGYDVSFDLTDGTGHAGEHTFGSTTTVRFTCREPGADTFIDLVAETVRSATLNGKPLDVSTYTEEGGLPLPDLAAENTLVVEADCRYSNSGEGLHRFVDPEDGQVYLYTHFEPAEAKRVFTCFDQPDLKATYTVHVTAPFDWQVVSNTGERTVEAGSSGSQLVHFAPTERLSTYLLALVAGPYARVTDSHEGIPLGLYCRASLAQHLDPEELFRVTKQGFDFYHRVFDYPYPFDKYDQLFVPEFNAGAMENAGAVTFLEDYVFRSRTSRARYERRAETILHELAHMWFGDLVTMRWWDDLWLNESFATYISTLCQAEATEYTTAWTTFANAEKAWAYAQDQLPSTHPIAADMVDVAAVEVNFDGITYAKGASVLKQLVAYVGREEFLAGIRQYFRDHEYGNTTLADLLDPLSEATGRDLTEWSEQWLQTSQVNTLRPVCELTEDGRYASFAIEQTAVPEHPVLRRHRLAVGLYDRGPDGLTRTTRVELDVDGARSEVAELVGHPAADLVLVNDDDLTYAKLRLDERSLATLRTSIGTIPDSLPRALCWSAAWDMTRDGELPARSEERRVGKECRSRWSPYH